MSPSLITSLMIVADATTMSESALLATPLPVLCVSLFPVVLVIVTFLTMSSSS
jgi:hypothetical protein